jgi:Tfp pilus assembly protein PilN
VRPVNLIPPEQRHGGTPVRTGPIAYLLVGALAIALGAVTMVVLANNKIGDRQAEVAQLKQQKAAASSQADQLQTFIQFSDSERQRTDTIRALANSRFDWERVMRELSLVLPNDVSLTYLTAAASSAASADASSPATAAPSLEMTGCAQGHEGVAGFLSALRDIDGVTSVDLQSSERADASSSSSSTGTSDCRTNSLISQFIISVAFGAVPAAQGSAAAPTAAAPTSAAPASTPSSTAAVPASATTAGTGG